METRILNSLDVVIPAYNEGTHVKDAITSLFSSAQAADIAVRAIIVDDGSSPEHAALLEELAEDKRIILIRQKNSGRFIARKRALESVETEYVLLLDSRVQLHRDALQKIQEKIVQKGCQAVNLDVHLRNYRSFFPLFWNGITKVWWRKYYRNKRDSVISLKNFDDYPKGTGAFFCKSELLKSAVESYESSFSDIRLASDDTKLLKNIAGRSGIFISPDISCDYFGKEGLKKWVAQCFYRGTTFVDGYFPKSSSSFLALTGLGLMILFGLFILFKLPFVAVALIILGSILAGSVVRYSGGSIRESVAVSLLTLPFGLVFGSGVIRGLLKIKKNED